MAGYAQSFYVLVFAHGQQVWPCVNFIVCAQCEVVSWVGEWPKGMFLEVTHVLGVSEFECLCVLCIEYAWGFLEVVGQFTVDEVIGAPIAYVWMGVQKAKVSSISLWLLIYACRLWVSMLCALVEILLSQYGWVCDMWMCGVGLGLFRVVPLFASWFMIHCLVY